MKCTCLMLLAGMSSAHAFTNQFKINNENLKQETVYKSLPSMKDHQKTIEEFLKERLNVKALNMVNHAEMALTAIDKNSKEESLKLLNQAQNLTQELQAESRGQDLQVVEYNIEVINEAPQDIKQIKEIRKAINRAYFATDFPKTRVLLSSLESELHMQTFQISLDAYATNLKAAKESIEKKDFAGAGLILNNTLSSVMVEDWGVPLPFVEAEAAIANAKILAEVNLDQAKEKVELAEYQLDRAEALGYITGEKEEFKMIKQDLKSIKKDIFKKTFQKKEFNFDRVGGYLFSFIKKHFFPKTSAMKIADKK